MASQTKFEQWEKARKIRQEALKWESLRGRTTCHQQGHEKAAISPGHCKPPMICIAGQFYQGGQNYWESSREVNQALLEYLIENWETVWPDIMEKLKYRERQALIACEEDLEMLQRQIDLAKRYGEESP